MSKRQPAIRIDRLALSLPAMSEADARAVARDVANRVASQISCSSAAVTHALRVEIECGERATIADNAARAIAQALRGKRS
jgi:hypothetical protein